MLRSRPARILAICTLLGAAACSSTDDSAAATPPAASIDDAMQAGVGVIALGCSASAGTGSGVVVDASGLVVTVAHNVAGATAISVVDLAGTEHPADVVAFDPDADLAVLDVDGWGAAALPVGQVQLGQGSLIRWSLDDGVSATPVDVTQRLAITIDDIYGASSVKRSGFEFSGSVVVGDSGGAVVAADGTVIGIVYARSKSRGSTGFAVDVDEINTVLNDVSDEPVGNGTCV